MTVESHTHRARALSLFVCAAAVLLLTSFWHSRTAPVEPPCFPIEGAITGVISYVGEPPSRVPIDTSADPVCSGKNPRLMTENEVVRNGKLANVFVYLKDGTLADGTKLSDISFPVPESPAVMDQNGCRFSPHVLGVQVNQEIRFTSSDPTYHNVHPLPSRNVEWNRTQPPGAEPLIERFRQPEVLIPLKCNQHPWMRAYIGVLRHPFFAVSNAAGAFQIKGVPAGTYTLVAWHEGGVGGTQITQQVVVSAKGISTADFSFGGATAGNQKPSLEMAPTVKVSMIRKH